MITNRRIFEDKHLPRVLEHRGAEESQLARAFNPVLADKPANDILIWGPSGVGKTVLARHMLDRLGSQTSFRHAHVECLGMSTTGIIRSVLDDLPGADPAANTPLEDLCLDLRDRAETPVFVVLDEAEEVTETDALDRLADVEPISLVVICHEPSEWLARAPDHIQQRLTGQELPLDRYGVDELADILEARARVGLQDDVVHREQLEELADNVAGVARDGIQSLLAAATIAEERGHPTIQADDVDDAYVRAREWIRKANLDSLPFHHHVLYELIRDWAYLTGRELHEHYDDVADEVYRDRERVPIGQRARRDKLSKLETYGLIESGGDTKASGYWIVDRDVSSPYSIPVTRARQ